MPEHSALITALLLDRRMCVDCIGIKTALTNAAVDGYLAVMTRVLRVARTRGECDSCGVTTTVISMERPQ